MKKLIVLLLLSSACSSEPALPQNSAERIAASFLKKHGDRIPIRFESARPYTRNDSNQWVVDGSLDSLIVVTKSLADTATGQVKVLANAEYIALKDKSNKLLENTDTTRIASQLHIKLPPLHWWTFNPNYTDLVIYPSGKVVELKQQP